MSLHLNKDIIQNKVHLNSTKYIMQIRHDKIGFLHCDALQKSEMLFGRRKKLYCWKYSGKSYFFAKSQIKEVLKIGPRDAYKLKPIFLFPRQ